MNYAETLSNVSTFIFKSSKRDTLWESKKRDMPAARAHAIALFLFFLILTE